MLFQAGYLGNATGGFVAKLNHYLSVEGQIDIDSGAEFYETHVLFHAHGVARLHIGDYATSHSTGYLAHEDVVTGGSVNNHGRALIFGACFR